MTEHGQVKQWLFERAKAEIRGFGMAIVEELCDSTRPWGAFLRISDHSLPAFYKAYWQGIEVPEAEKNLRLDPKLLLVAPQARLSLQYHHRRREHWRVLDGPVRIVVGPNQDRLQEIVAQTGEVIRIEVGYWHRLEGLDCWGRVAEIWEHADPDHPSDENDIVRVQDDYGR